MTVQFCPGTLRSHNETVNVDFCIGFFVLQIVASDVSVFQPHYWPAIRYKLHTGNFMFIPSMSIDLDNCWTYT